ncbi:substrate-binding domain-containing protein [Yoonia sp.]|uniref:substrate-binding domain-containing protein n=1 Tax=Yoonia sp. TaxID=2212373 RepID=UPI0025FA67DF|nr:substrate-binding domain-containing protein [Yoonia sp.]
MNKITSLAAASTLVTTLIATTATARTVAFLMPDQASTRNEEKDWPGFQAAMTALFPDCTLIYQNGNADVALQQQQFNSVIAQGARVVVLDPVDSAAAAALVEISHPDLVSAITDASENSVSRRAARKREDIGEDQ